MSADRVFPVLVHLVALVGVGQLLRLTGAVPREAPAVLGRLIVLVTMPALVVGILADARLDSALLPALVAHAAGLLVALVLAVRLVRALGGARPAQGAAGLTAAFSNTGFLGVPFVLALLPGARAAATTAVILDTVNTTILLLTLGVAFATAMGRTDPAGRGPGLATTALRISRQPLILAAALGLCLGAMNIPVPPAIAGTLTRVGESTPTLAFLTIGLGLDLGALRGQALPVAGIALLKLLVAPAVAAAVLLALGIHGEVAQTAVLQAAMPTAVISSIIAADAGCDGRLAAAAAVITTLLALITLPLIVAVLPHLGL